MDIRGIVIFGGRIDRANYILGLLFLMALFFGLSLIIAFFFGGMSRLSKPIGNEIMDSFFFVFFLAFLGLMIGVFSLHVRRFHDLGHRGWKVLLFFVPLVNIVFLCWLLFAKGDEGGNKYGGPVREGEKFLNVLLGRIG